ncbi:MAG: hypothetical protein IPP72_15210 [Chitinophagaceae bacterium]|nr:hypothetical protein [Chitinophagaceae bacterium]
MKKIFLSAGCIFFAAMMTQAQSGRIGIGTNTPLARLHVADSNVLLSANGPATAAYLPVPVDGPGRRMMWYVDKAAFRTGYVDGSNWSQDSIGFYSIAGGFDCKASGTGSVALGYSVIADGSSSVAMGDHCIASAAGGFSLGQENQARATNAVALGESNIASGTNSFVMGQNNRAKGFASIAVGGPLLPTAHYPLPRISAR